MTSTILDTEIVLCRRVVLVLRTEKLPPPKKKAEYHFCQIMVFLYNILGYIQYKIWDLLDFGI